MHLQTASTAAGRSNSEMTGVLHGLARRGSPRLMAATSVLKKAPGEILFAEGDDSDSVYEVLDGMVRLCKLLPDGRRLITGFQSRGRLLGVAPEGACVYTAEAITNVKLCRYTRATFDRLIDEVPGFAKRLLAVASDELRAAQDQMLLLGRKSATEKVATFILLMADQQNGDEATVVDVPMTRGDIADYLGLTIETVSRSLTRLKRSELIALPTPSHIEILDRDGLEEVAAGDEDGDF